MKRQLLLKLIIAVGPTLALLVGLAGMIPTSLAQGPLDTTFTYQGRLRLVGGVYVTGACDFQFSLWNADDSQVAGTGTLDRTSVGVTDGYFTVDLDFGDVFTGPDRYLQVAVRCPAGSGTYDTLGGRVKLAPNPYAMAARNTVAGSAAWADVTAKPAGFADDVDNVVTYTNGFGLALSPSPANQFSVITSSLINTATLQKRVTGACFDDQTIQTINSDGSVHCATARTPYSAGEGVGEHVSSLTGRHVLDYDADVVQGRVVFTCSTGTAIRRIYPNGSLLCESIPQGDIRTLNASDGLTGGGSSGVVTVSVAAGGITRAKLDASVVGTSKLADGAVTAAKIVTNAVADTTKIANGTILPEDIASNGCADSMMLVHASGVWTCTSDTPGDLTGGVGISISGTVISTALNANAGLSTTGGPLSLEFGGTGSASSAARSDHGHDSTYVRPTDTYSRDVSGSFNSGFTVVGIRGIPIPATTPANNQLLVYNGSQWSLVTNGFPFSVVVTQRAAGTSERNDSEGQIWAHCLSGETLVGGGCICGSNNQDQLEDAYPDGDVWQCNCENSNGGNHAYARCLQNVYP
jgi:hypothetical protein